MKKLLLLLLIVSCNHNDCKEEIEEIEEIEETKEYREVCEGCTRRWYYGASEISTIPWGWEGCEADGNIYRYEDRDGTDATNHYPSSPGSYFVIRCTTKQVEI